MAAPVDILTIDVEEWFHGHNYLQSVPPALWEAQESRVEANTERCLQMLAAGSVRATFFVLGWVAARHPDLVQRIAAAGHEIGCHSHAHPVLHRLSEREFLDDLDRALGALRAAGIAAPAGYRAPSFSLTPSIHHYLVRLRERGFLYDSSLFPIHHPRYGQPTSPRRPFLLVGAEQRRATAGGGDAATDPGPAAPASPGAPLAPEGIVEVPMTTARLLGLNVPFSGGAYLRLLPWGLHQGLRRLAARQGIPTITYLHPWELDDYRPAGALRGLARLRSQGGQESMPGKLAAILAEGRFMTMGEYVAGRRAAGDLPRLRLPLS
jgi:polysaccharide deacetylase family protein (PEP-CTERM system associated)